MINNNYYYKLAKSVESLQHPRWESLQRVEKGLSEGYGRVGGWDAADKVQKSALIIFAPCCGF